MEVFGEFSNEMSTDSLLTEGNSCWKCIAGSTLEQTSFAPLNTSGKSEDMNTQGESSTCMGVNSIISK